MSVFSDIYASGAWNGVESASGPGSGHAATVKLRPAILDLVAELEVTSVLEVGCGDGYWMPDLPGYVGIDVAPEAVKIARKRHPRRDYRVGTVFDVDPSAFDLIICRDVIQHLSLAEGKAVVEAVWDRGYLLMSTFLGGWNHDITSGGAYSPDMTEPPFDLPAPSRLIFDGYGYEEPTIRDPRKFLGLW